MLNQVTIQGRLTIEPVLNHTKSGQAVTTVPIACERDIRADENGKRPTDFFEIVAWDKHAENLCANYHKGQLVNITGRLKNRNWIDRSGVEQKGCEITLARIYSISAPRVKQNTNDFPNLGSRDPESDPPAHESPIPTERTR